MIALCAGGPQRGEMNDVQSTIVGLKAQDCPGGGWNGMPKELERATVADCLAHGVCGCVYGDAIQHIERLRAALRPFAVPDECWAKTFWANDQTEPVLIFENGMRIDRGHFDAACKALEGK